MQKTQGLFVVAASYVLALATAIGAGWLVRGLHPVAMLLVADVAGTFVIFAFSVAFKNSSFYDPYWSVQPIALAAYWLWAHPMNFVQPRHVVVFAMVVWWGARLTYNWARGWTGLQHEDWRYVDLQAKHGRAYWLVSFSGIHMFPTLLVFGGCLALWPVYTSNAGIHLIDILALIVTVGAILIEQLADRRLHRFKRTKTSPDQILDTGLWAYSRHPNYLGEVGFWWGLWLFGLAARPTLWWTVAGPLAINLLFVFISIPLIDERHCAKRPAYADHMKRIPGLVPRPWRRA